MALKLDKSLEKLETEMLLDRHVTFYGKLKGS